MLVWELSEDFTELELYPFNDLHVGDPRSNLPLFQKFIKYILDEPNRYLLYIGDNINNAIKSSVSNVYQEIMSPDEQKDWLIDELYPARDRFLCFVPGNHEARTKRESDISIVKDIARALGKKDLYREDESFLKITLGKQSSNKRVSYHVWAVHGTGGGATPGAVLNRMYKASTMVEGVDIYIQGHAHQKIGYKYSKRVFDPYNNKIRHAPMLTACSASWLEYGGYAANKQLIPGSIGKTPIILSGKKKDFYVKI